eukprot:7290106-Prymnesium_polylepis.1
MRSPDALSSWERERHRLDIYPSVVSTTCRNDSKSTDYGKVAVAASEAPNPKATSEKIITDWLLGDVVTLCYTTPSAATHSLLHTEAHEIAHLCAEAPSSHPAHAHTRRIVDEARGLAPPRPDLPGPGAAS